ncbi:MAG: hypothetical protein Q7R98_00905 [Candidatus Jorgensenbacteria bacterium]|nr:hypothetical protein [Candidatus Jorgensenbacteria bacterium]
MYCTEMHDGKICGGEIDVENSIQLKGGCMGHKGSVFCCSMCGALYNSDGHALFNWKCERVFLFLEYGVLFTKKIPSVPVAAFIISGNFEDIKNHLN